MSRAQSSQGRVAGLSTLLALGFDSSYERDDEPGQYKVRCSQCDALVIQGLPTHERGCPNRTHSCEECGELIPVRRRVCDSCANPLTDDAVADSVPDADDCSCFAESSDAEAE